MNFSSPRDEKSDVILLFVLISITVSVLIRQQPKLVKKQNIEKHRQRWSSPNNRISSDGNGRPKNIASKERPSPSQRHKNLTITQVCTQDSEYVQHLVNRMHAKHIVNRDYETLLLGDFG